MIDECHMIEDCPGYDRDRRVCLVGSDDCEFAAPDGRADPDARARPEADATDGRTPVPRGSSIA
jgi:hypothetical protein